MRAKLARLRGLLGRTVAQQGHQASRYMELLETTQASRQARPLLSPARTSTAYTRATSRGDRSPDMQLHQFRESNAPVIFAVSGDEPQEAEATIDSDDESD